MPKGPVPFPEMQQTRLYRPAEGDGPFPAVVLLHTCGGVGRHILDWARRLTADGYATLLVASNGARNVPNNCQGFTAAVTQELVAGDAVAALAHLGTVPFVQRDRLAVVGYSWGAMSGIRLSGADYHRRAGDRIAGLRAIGFFYGSCGSDSLNAEARRSSDTVPSDLVTPTLMLLGAIDTESPPRFCVQRAESLARQGKPIAYKLYPDTTHSFDEQNWGTQGRMMNQGARGTFLYRYNPGATEDAARELASFLARHLKS